MNIRKSIRGLLILFALAFTIAGCGANSSKEKTDTGVKTYTLADISKLKNTENFADGTIEHIFNGTINKSGNATGYHYDMVSDSDGKIIGNKGKPDKNGIYTAKVAVNGKEKSANNGMSTFYPDSYTPQQVVDLINEAYKNRRKVSDDLYSGTAKGIVINMYLNNKNKMTTAYPVMK